MVTIVIALIVGYLIGAIPSGYIYGKIKGIDVRKVGFKRIGASNIYKTFGFIPAILVFFADFLKPILAIFITRVICGWEVPSLFPHIAGIFAIIGHNWPVWLKFQGEGRGIASSLGFLYFLVPTEVIIVFVILFPIGVWLKSTAFLTFVFFCITPFVVLSFNEPISVFWLSVIVAILTFITRVVKGIKEIKAAENKRNVVFNLLFFDSHETQQLRKVK